MSSHRIDDPPSAWANGLRLVRPVFVLVQLVLLALALAAGA